MVIKGLLALAIAGNIALAGILVSTKSNQFKNIVRAAQSIKDSRVQISGAVSKFNIAIANIERVTKRVDSNVKKVETSIDKVRGDIDRLHDALRF